MMRVQRSKAVTGKTIRLTQPQNSLLRYTIATLMACAFDWGYKHLWLLRTPHIEALMYRTIQERGIIALFVLVLVIPVVIVYERNSHANTTPTHRY